jgi:hypothetical protein
MDKDKIDSSLYEVVIDSYLPIPRILKTGEQDGYFLIDPLSSYPSSIYRVIEETEFQELDSLFPDYNREHFWEIVCDCLDEYRREIITVCGKMLVEYSLLGFSASAIRKAVHYAFVGCIKRVCLFEMDPEKYKEQYLSKPSAQVKISDSVFNMIWEGVFWNNEEYKGVDLWTFNKEMIFRRELNQRIEVLLFSEDIGSTELTRYYTDLIYYVLETAGLLKDSYKYIGETYHLRALTTAMIKEARLTAIVNKYKKISQCLLNGYGVRVSDRALRKPPKSDAMKDIEKVAEDHFRAIIKDKASS